MAASVHVEVLGQGTLGGMLNAVFVKTCLTLTNFCAQRPWRLLTKRGGRKVRRHRQQKLRCAAKFHNPSEGCGVKLGTGAAILLRAARCLWVAVRCWQCEGMGPAEPDRASARHTPQEQRFSSAPCPARGFLASDPDLTPTQVNKDV